MNISHYCTFCLCSPPRSNSEHDNKRSSKSQEAEEEPYGTIAAVESRPPTTISSVFCINLKRKKKAVRIQNAEEFSDKAGPSKPPAQPKRDPPSRKKKVSFSWRNRRKPSDTGPAYDYIDAEGPDPVYSKVGENLPSLRYDYPTFSSRERTRKTVVNEPFYTSASLHSHIYSGGSEDPYSSIISDGGNMRATEENNSGIYDTGYARVKGDGSKPTNPLNVKHNLDALYAKINRRAVAACSSNYHQKPSTSSASGGISGLSSANSKSHTAVEAPSPHNFLSTSTDNDQPYQLEESGSGSIASGSSQNPSYRYLTVRESVDVMRERIRRREQEMAANGQRNQGPDLFPLREHYYSTIANEYESVGDDSAREHSYAVDRTTPFSFSQHTFSNRYSWNGSNRVPVSTALSLNTGARLGSTTSPDAEMSEPLRPPPPPTSPIPNRGDQQYPAVILRPVVLSPTMSIPRLMSASYNQPSQNSTSTPTTEKTLSNPNLLATRNQGSAGQPKNRSSYSNDPRVMNIPVAVRMSYMHRQPPAVPNGLLPAAPPPLVHSELSNGSLTKQQAAATIDTAEMKNQSQQSKIPIPLSNSNSLTMRSTTPSPTVEAGTQTSRILKQNISLGAQANGGKKKAPKQLPMQVGNDYVSPVDLGNARGWPLDNKEEGGAGGENLE